MTTQNREKRAGVCENCSAVCAVWRRPDGEILPISSTSGCDCEEPSIRVVDALGTPDGTHSTR
ncbi:hypothetical protein [Natronococcus sp. A-GB7]|jgi:hypothetical protein|uniref:hypothetical protein n=1 Tax=Natronococcus sp. A-GB7 TaxID=3037649 RepID=UPI00241F9990|nr:hypothetical protein [Natronococcus sp. A-GB7]MDG5819886.1 hypothetical protein [Natronococcus sp. A-GB7]